METFCEAIKIDGLKQKEAGNNFFFKKITIIIIRRQPTEKSVGFWWVGGFLHQLVTAWLIIRQHSLSFTTNQRSPITYKDQKELQFPARQLWLLLFCCCLSFFDPTAPVLLFSPLSPLHHHLPLSPLLLLIWADGRSAQSGLGGSRWETTRT